MKLGLVLTGGGARAAYQAGVIQAIAEISKSNETPFKIVTGVSAGAINGSHLASRADQFQQASRDLVRLWSELSSDLVYKTDIGSTMKLGGRWLSSIGLGNPVSNKANHLLNTAPLRELLERELRLDKLQEFFKNNILHGVSFSATNYLTGTAISFYDGHESIEPWIRSTRIGLRSPLSIQHVMASSAIPVFFPPAMIDQVPFGDGCIRLTSPLSPAIHLGADRIIAVGIRFARTDTQIIEMNQTLRSTQLTLAQIGGVLLNAVFLDSLETDVERMERINKTLSLLTSELRAQYSLKSIPVLTLRPSQDLGQLAIGTLKEFPSIIRFLLKGIGAKDDKGWDLLSYLAFEKNYTRQLIELGYEDTLKRKVALEAFFSEETNSLLENN